MSTKVSNLFKQRVALKTMNLLLQHKATHYSDGLVFYIFSLDGRVVIAFDPNAIRLERVGDRFVHDLSTRLQGRRVVRTNTRGLFLQVATDTPGLSVSLDEQVPLDLSQQPSAWHLPVGLTKDGPLWIPLMGGISFLIGGSTGTGKTGEEHAWIQALLHGGKTLVYAWDGKHSVEFMRYADRPNFHLVTRASEIEQMQALFRDREKQLAWSGCVNIWDHNERHPGEPIFPVALIVDEAADLPDSTKNVLKQMIRLYRYVGLYPVICTNQPTVSEMFAKVNLQTRISFRVPHHNDSVTMLGYKGAEALPAVRGRGLIAWNGRLVEFQSFQVTYPPVSDEVRQLVASSVSIETEEPVDEITRLAESIRSQWTPEMSKRAVGRLLGISYAGGMTAKIDKIIEFLTATTATATTDSPDSGENWQGG